MTETKGSRNSGAATPEPPLIEIRGLTKLFEAVRALEGLDMTHL